MTSAERVRATVNTLNGATLLGLGVALCGRARISTGPAGLLLAVDYRLRLPPALAFTVGNVVLSRLSADELAGRPALLRHECRHATQYAWCLGPVMIPLYLAAAGWSWVRTGDFASRNVFERAAGLSDGGYVERPVRPVFAGPAPRP